MFSRITNSISGVRKPLQWLVDFVGGGQESSSGIRVNTKSALGYPPVWYAVNKIGGHIGQLPLVLHRKTDDGRERALTHPAYQIMKRRPNQFQSSCVFRETMMAHALLMGNGRSVIIRDTAGRPVELIPMAPDRTVTAFVDGEKWHATTVEVDDPISDRIDTAERNSKIKWYKFPDTDVLHIQGLSINGIEGVSLIEVARETLGLGLGGQKATARNFRSSRPGIIIEAPVGMFRNDEDAQDFVDNFNKGHSELDNAGKTGMVKDGMKLHAFPMNARDAEWLSQRKFERQDTALLFLLEQILGDDSSVSYNSLEQKNLAYLTNCLMRWIIKWEEECYEKLLTEREKKLDSHFFKFNFAALLRADSKTQMETISGYINTRVYSPNEARELLDMNPYDGGDEYANPAITPGSGDTKSEPDEQADNAVRDRIRHLVGVEKKRVLAAAKTNPNFCDWLDSFYSNWKVTLSRAVIAMGGTEYLATDHCIVSHGDLLELAGRITDELSWPSAVESHLSSWTERADTLADQITQKEASHA